VASGLVPEITVVTPEAGLVSLGTYTAGAETRVRIEVTGREVKFYLTEVGTGKPPVYVSPVAPSYPLRAYAVASIVPTGGGSGSARVRQVMMTTNPLPTAVISADVQQQVFGSLKEPLRVRVRQHSGVREIGWGLPFEKEI
jgi:hypothetical protein